MKNHIILSFLALIMVFACEDKPDEPPGPTIYAVKYEVTGSVSVDMVDITIENEDGGTSQYADVLVPWDYEFQRVEGSFVYVSAQNQGEAGSITVTIYRNDTVFKTSTSSGGYVIATASGML